jgi:hypothetical protein
LASPPGDFPGDFLPDRKRASYGKACDLSRATSATPGKRWAHFLISFSWRERRSWGDAKIRPQLTAIRKLTCVLCCRCFQPGNLADLPFATRLRQKGVALEDIADLLGHKTLAMTKRYAHISMDRLHQAVKQLSVSSSDTTSDTEQSKAIPVQFAVAS